MKESSGIPSKAEKQKGETATKGVAILLGEPKKAIIKLAVPMIIAMSVMTIYNLVDVFWVAGLGGGAIAAVGLFLPFMFIIMSLSNGLGVGGGSAISRRIGSKDRQGADQVAVHTLIIMIIMVVCFTIPFFLFTGNIFNVLAEESEVKEMATAYGQIVFGGSLVIFFLYVATAILRAEGDANRAMYAMMLGAGLNIALDPIFIFTLNMGVVGAAWATVLSMTVTSALLLYWLFIKKDTYITFKFRGFQWAGNIVKDIFRVGLPAMVLQLSMAITQIILIVIIGSVSSDSGVAVYTLGWRVSMIAVLPLLGIATAVVSVTGAAYGANEYDKLKSSFLYAVKIGLIIELIIALITFLFASQITGAFPLPDDEHRDFILQELPQYFQIVAIFYPGVAFGMMSSSMFQGTGKGSYALIVTIVRAVILGTMLPAIFAIGFDMGISGVWWGLVGGNIIGSMLAFTWGVLYVRKLQAEKDG
jgi:putative MATE family efflux protein